LRRNNKRRKKGSITYPLNYSLS